MYKTEIYNCTQILGLTRYNFDKIMNCKTRMYKKDAIEKKLKQADTYKAGTHYGTISPREI